MAQGYTRNDTSNNIATGNIINATDLDGEFDALQSAFDATSGHNHDGTVGGGSPISTLGPTQEIVVTTTAIRPSADNTIDLGTSTLEFKDLYIDGTANIDSLVADTADINGGTIDNATIATSNITVGAGKTLDVSAGTLTLANDQISGDNVEGGTIAATTITTLTSTTVNATTVDTTNLEVTTLKAKDGTTAGTVANTTGVVTITSLVATTADVNGGTVDGTTIGASVPAAGTFTTVTASGDLTIADKIVHSGDTDTSIRFPAADTVTVETSGAERLRITSAGNVGINKTSPTVALDVVGRIRSSDTVMILQSTGDLSTTGIGYLSFRGSDTVERGFTGFGAGNADFYVWNTNSANIRFGTSGTERMRIDASGNVGIGTSSPTGNLTIGGSSPRLDFLETGGSAGFDNTILIRDADIFAIQTRNGGTFVSNDYRMTANASGALTHEWRIGNTERMRINSSGNVGIGTGNPLGLLQVEGQIRSNTTSSTAVVGLRTSLNDTAYTLVGDNLNANLSELYSFVNPIRVRSPDYIALQTGGTNERMRITSTGNVGIGTSSPGAALDVFGGIRSTSAGGNSLIVTTSIGDTTFANNGVNWLTVKNGAPVDTVRITSAGNVGIGTTSPANKLDVRTGTTGNIAAFYGTSTYHLAIEEVGGVMFLDANNGSATIGFKTNDTERMRLDSSGNLGLGVTPSAWTSSVKAAQLNTKAAIYGSSSATGLGFNVFNDGSNKYLTTDAATLYLLGAGSHAWYNAPSGTAGNAITFTQAMTLDASGNLDVGNSSTAVSSTTRTTSIKSSNIGNLVFGITQNAVTMGSSVTAADIYTTAALDMRFGTNNTERMRISSVGALGIGGANYGTSGQVLTSGGSGAAPSWADLSSSQVGSATAGLAYGAVGTYAFVYRSGTGVTEDTTYAGSALNIAGIHSGATSVTADSTGAADLTRGSATLSGTWRVMGRSNAGSTLTRARGFLALRIS